LGQREYFADRWARHEQDRGVLLVACDSRGPLGVVYLWLEPAEESVISRHLPNVPLLTHLEVLAEERGRGIGTLLIEEAAQCAQKRGYASIALAVRTDNTRAARLYRRLDYHQWGNGEVECLTEEWRPGIGRVRHSEECHILVRALAAKAVPPPET
jgi:GNAT superfamily N-acetyltransferase